MLRLIMANQLAGQIAKQQSLSPELIYQLLLFRKFMA